MTMIRRAVFLLSILSPFAYCNASAPRVVPKRSCLKKTKNKHKKRVRFLDEEEGTSSDIEDRSITSDQVAQADGLFISVKEVSQEEKEISVAASGGIYSLSLKVIIIGGSIVYIVYLYIRGVRRSLLIRRRRKVAM